MDAGGDVGRRDVIVLAERDNRCRWHSRASRVGNDAYAERHAAGALPESINQEESVKGQWQVSQPTLGDHIGRNREKRPQAR